MKSMGSRKRRRDIGRPNKKLREKEEENDREEEKMSQEYEIEK
jgi:hypothetical protein